MKSKNFTVKFYLSSVYDEEVKGIHCPSGCFEKFNDAFNFVTTEYNKLWLKLCDLGVEIEKNTDINFEIIFKRSIHSDALDRIIWNEFNFAYEKEGTISEISRYTEKYDPDFFSFIFGFCVCLQEHKLMVK